MKTVYAVRSVPVRDQAGATIGWARVDVIADGTSPHDLVYLQDGRAYEQAAAIEAIARDRRLLWRTRAEAVRDGIAGLRAA